MILWGHSNIKNVSTGDQRDDSEGKRACCASLVTWVWPSEPTYKVRWSSIHQPSSLSSSGPGNLQYTVAWRTQDPAWNRVEGESQLLKDVLWHMCPHTYISYTSLSDTDTHIHMCTKDYDYQDWENSSVSRALAGKLWIPDLRSLVPIGKPRAAYPSVISALGCQRQADLYWSVSLNQMQTPEAEESLSQQMRWKVIEDNT